MKKWTNTKSLRAQAIGLGLGVAGLPAVLLGQISFTLGPTFQTPARPSGVAVADYNGDGHPDLAVASDSPDKITIYFGHGDGTISVGQVIHTGSSTSPENLISADINGDTFPDIAVVLHGAGQVRSYLNNGAGAFAPGSNVPAGSNSRAIIAVDLDADGLPDFMVANRDSNDVTVVRNTAGVLSSGGSFAAGLEPRGVAAADFDGDGLIDIAVPAHDSRTVVLLRGTAAGGFAAWTTLTPPSNNRPEGIASGDLDGDGRADLIIGADNRIGVYRNVNGVFGAPVSFDTGGVNAGRIDVADLDGDGRRDIVVGNEDSGNVSIFANTTVEGAASISLAAPAVFATGAHPEQFDIADMDNNGTLDLVVPNRDSNTTTILLNGSGLPGAPLMACRTDANRNGQLEVEDILVYLNSWLAGSPGADMNFTGGVDVQDIFDFLNAWLAGC
ncbi:MAG TPA: VCBS repeat-containing protein [Phycisphaerales bacterium]|nr:VCBS repeat-containing protein [Phycisphaerales bacterium]